MICRQESRHSDDEGTNFWGICNNGSTYYRYTLLSQYVSKLKTVEEEVQEMWEVRKQAFVH